MLDGNLHFQISRSKYGYLKLSIKMKNNLLFGSLEPSLFIKIYLLNRSQIDCNMSNTSTSPESIRQSYMLLLSAHVEQMSVGYGSECLQGHKEATVKRTLRSIC